LLQKKTPGCRRGGWGKQCGIILPEEISRTGGCYMKTREETIVEITRALKALRFNIESMKIKHAGEMDNPQYTEIKLKIIKLD
jgi:hypothetical protein